MNTSLGSALPWAKAAPCRRAGSAQPTCHFDCCLWLRPHRGEFAKTPHSVGLGSWYHLLWLWFCALTGRFLRLAVVSPSESARGTQPKATSGRKAGGRRGGGSQPLSCDHSNAGDYREFQGELYPPPHSWAHLKGSPLPPPFPWEFGTASRTPELCWATASNFQAVPPADYHDMMSFFIEARLGFFFFKFSKVWFT